MQRISTHNFEYAGRQLKVGDTFDCEENDVTLLSALGWIEREEAKKQTYLTRDMSRKRKS